MTKPSAQEMSSAPTTVADIMRPPLTTVEQDAHLAAAAYLMKRAGATALVVLDDVDTKRPIGLITEADIVRAVADDMDVNDVRIRDVMTSRMTFCTATMSIRGAAESMITGGFRHLPVVDDASLVGMIDIGDVSRALLDAQRG